MLEHPKLLSSSINILLLCLSFLIHFSFLILFLIFLFRRDLQMPSIRLVSFDAFETLIFPRFPPAVVYSHAAREINVFVDPKRLAPLYTESYLHYRKKYPNFGHYAGIAANDWWAKVIRRSLKPFLAHGQSIPNAFCTALYDRYKCADLWRVESGAVSCLEAIHALEPNRYVSVLSNFDERLPDILAELRLDTFFDDILYSCGFPFHKPDPRFFRLLIDLHPTVSADECLHIGNSTQRDYAPAMKMGMKAFLYRPPASPEKVEPDVQSIRSLMDILDELKDMEP